MRWKRYTSTPVSFYLHTLLTAFVFLCPGISLPQSAANQPGTPIDVTAHDLEASEIRNNWLSYHGDLTGRRYSSLDKINRENISELQLKWVFHTRKVRVLGATPVVVGGVMYMTASNDLFAIDARTGAVLWHHSRPESESEKEDESAHVNRGVAVLSNKVYMETDDAHLLCLDARSGNALWEAPFAGGYANSSGVSTPLVVKDKIIVGSTGGKQVQGSSVTAFDAASGKEIWRFEIQSAYGESWIPGTYDPKLDVIFWEIGGQSCNPQTNNQPADTQQGRCLIALDSNTGKLKWKASLAGSKQAGFAASGIPVLFNTAYQGAPHRLIIEVDASGFLQILDRETGELLGQTNFNRAESSKHTCLKKWLLPSWNPPSYSDQTHLFYAMSLEGCRTRPAETAAARPATKTKTVSKPISKINLFAYDPLGDKVVWRSDFAMNHVPTGVMTTATGLLLFGGESQSFRVADAATGKVLWSFPMGQSPTGSPMSYAIGDDQYFAIAAGNDLLVFGLP